MKHSSNRRLLTLPALILLMTACAIAWKLWPRASADSGILNPPSQKPRIALRTKGEIPIALQDGVEMMNAYVGADGIEQALIYNQATPLSLATADFDEDGTPDLVSGYGYRGKGIIALNRGNIDAIYPNHPAAKRRKEVGSYTDSPFLEPALVFSAPAEAQFLAAGDFDNDGHADLIVASRNRAALYLLRGDGHGGLAEAERRRLPGPVTALAAGEIDRADGLTDLIVAISGEQGPQALILQGPDGAIKAGLQSFQLPAEAASIITGHFDDDPAMDAAIAAANRLIILYGREQQIAENDLRPRVGEVDFPVAISALSSGEFTGDNQTDIAALCADGRTYVLERVKSARSPFAEEKMTARSESAQTINRSSTSPFKPEFRRAEPAPGAGARSLVIASKEMPVWRESNSFTVPATDATDIKPLALVSGRITGLFDDLLVIESRSNQIHIASPAADNQTGERQTAKGFTASLDVEGGAAALLPMRLGASALNGLVILRSDKSAPVFMTQSPGAVLSVTNTLDDGLGSLRKAIEDANDNPGADTITFNLPGAGVRTITLASALPTINDPLTIDATSQPDYAGVPLIELSGNNSVVTGLRFTANNNFVAGLIINRFLNFGIDLASSGNIIESNYIGTDSTSAIGRANGQDGIFVTGSNNIIGGPLGAGGNVLSGNNRAGVEINTAGTTATNIVQGNFIGTNFDGTIAVGNLFGIVITDSSDNRIGGTTLTGNIISGNFGDGLFIQTSNPANPVSQNNIVAGNIIGLTPDGETAIPNVAGYPNILGAGVRILDAPINTIGGTAVASANIISGNLSDGIEILGTPAGPHLLNTKVQGNLIGMNSGGSRAIGNGVAGILIGDSDGNKIGKATADDPPLAQNFLSGNGRSGVAVVRFNLGAGPDRNVIDGNAVGTNDTGNGAVPNAFDGIEIENAINTMVRDNQASGNGRDGIRIAGTNTAGTILAKNRIGIDFVFIVGDDPCLPNQRFGIFLDNAAGVTIGESGGENIIGCNPAGGIVVSNNSTDNIIHSNFIGTDSTLARQLGNQSEGVLIEAGSLNNTVENNQILFNGTFGVGITGAGTKMNTVRSNQIKNQGVAGVSISNGAAENRVEQNTLEANAVNTAGAGGIGIAGLGTDQNKVLNNQIINNLSQGVQIVDGAKDNLIADNTIQGNGTSGVRIEGSTTKLNKLQRNQIKDNSLWGVEINNAVENFIGGSRTASPPEGNTIHGNGGVNDPSLGGGVLIRGNSAQLNKVQANLIGLNAQVTFAEAVQSGNHGNGIRIENAAFNLIGGENMDDFFNVISGNGWINAPTNNITVGNAKFASGVLITGGGGNEVRGNIIGGISPDGSSGGNGQAMLNVTNGLMIENSNDNLIGSNDDDVNPVQFIAGNGLGNLPIEVRDTLANVQIEGGARSQIKKNFIGVNSNGQFLQPPPDSQFVAFFLFGLRAGGVSDTDIGCPRNPALLIPFCNRIVGLSVSGSNVRIKGNLLGGRSVAPDGSIFTNSVNGSVTVGGSQPFEGNTIINNKIGLQVSGPGAVVQGNEFGIIDSELGQISNRIGIEANGGVLIGGEDPNAKNIIWFSLKSGIVVATGTDTMIIGNEIRNNAVELGGNTNFPAGIDIGCRAGDTVVQCNPTNNEPRNTIIRLNDISDNANSGIAIRAGAKNSFIGLNRIHNNLAGVTIDHDISQGLLLSAVRAEGHRISENSIFNNGLAGGSGNGLGIDLNTTGQDIEDEDGITLNGGVGVVRPGPNFLQNFPRLLKVSSSSSGTHIMGFLNAQANRQYSIEFFRNSVCDNTLDPRPELLNVQHGEGEEFLTFRAVADSSGAIRLNLRIPQIIPPGQFLTTTATDLETNNTSEFSRCLVVAQDSDGDGISDEDENAAPNNGDGNNDGIPDRQQKNVSSLQNAVNGNLVTLVSPAGTELTDVAALPNPARGEQLNPSLIEQPPNTSFPIGFFEFTVQDSAGSGIKSGAPALSSTAVTLINHGPAQSFTSYFNNGPTPDNSTPHWYEFNDDGTTGAQINGQTITLQLADNGRGDHDGAADGKITSFGGPATPLQNPAEVSITKSGPASAACSQQISYTLQITNTGANAAANVIAFDPLPACLTEITCQTTLGTCEVGNQSIAARIASLAAGETATVTINARAGFDCGATMTNIAIVDADNDATFSNNLAQATTSVSCSDLPDVTVVNSAPQMVNCNETVTYTITAQNLGTLTANDVTVTDTLPACLTNINGSTSQGTLNINGNTVTANLGALPGQAMATITITATVGVTCGANISNTATITASNDSNTGNNSSTANTAINCAPPLVVTNTNDSGAGSLREALTNAAASPGSTILFNIPTSDPGFANGVFTITMTSAPPDVAGNGTYIDGASEAAFLGADPNPAGPDIRVIVPQPVGQILPAFRITAANCLARGFFGTSIQITGANASGNRVEGCYLGTNADGTVPPPANPIANLVLIDGGAHDNLIGGTTQQARNIFVDSSNSNGMLQIVGAGTNNNRVQGNYFGLNAAGTAAIGRARISISNGAQNNLIGGTAASARNVLASSDNQFDSLQIVGAGTNNNRVQGNFFGTDATGTRALGNRTQGSGPAAIRIADGASNNLVGGIEPGVRNVISPPTTAIIISADNGPGTDNNVVQGNFIGTDVTGTRAVDDVGVRLAVGKGLLIITSDGNPATGNLVGGATEAARNIIVTDNLSGGGGTGVEIDASGNMVQGNFIGTDVNGVSIGRLGTGVDVQGSNNEVGGATSAPGTPPGNLIKTGLVGVRIASGFDSDSSNNLIQGNRIEGMTIAAQCPECGTGIVLSPPGGSLANNSNMIRGNSITANARLGIDLIVRGFGGSDIFGVTPNDNCDADSGANNLQNFPVLTSAMSATGTGTTITGTLNSAANADFTIEFFANDACDQTGNGEGQTPIGTATITTSPSCIANINITLPTVVPNGQLITATAADPEGNTSEFSACVNVQGPTLAEFASLDATAFADGVLLEWRTSLEVDNLGFNLYREQGGTRSLVNPQIIAGSALLAGHSTPLLSGHSYAWWDAQNAAYRKAQYWLEAIDISGQSDWFGPFEVKASGLDPPPSKREFATLLSKLGSNQTGSTRILEPISTIASRPSAEQEKNQASLASQGAIKISVKRAGFYTVSAQELFNSGLAPNVDPRLLQMFVDGSELPLSVRTDKSGLLEAVEFYATAFETPSTDERIYWLAVGAQPGRRLALLEGKGQPSSSRYFIQTLERRDRLIYFASLLNGERENFFGPVVTTSSVEQHLNVSHLYGSTGGEAMLEIALQGVSLTPHLVAVDLNGVQVGDVAFNGQSQGSGRFTLPGSLLKESLNLVRLTALTGSSDVSLIDYVRISYPHAFSAEGSRLSFTANGNEVVTVDGFTSEAIRVFDITDASTPFELASQINKAGGGFAVTVASPLPGERRLLALSNAESPLRVWPDQPSSLRSRGGADLVIVTRREFIESLNPLVALRQSQKMAVTVVDIEDIYDEFSFGQKTPVALKEFLAYTNQKWKRKPLFALLVGDASFDPKNYLGLGDNDYVPTKFVDATYLETASDDWLADFNLDDLPDIAIGRLPARQAADVENLVGKIIAYEDSTSPQEVLLVADANDGYDFESAASGLKQLLPPRVRATEIKRGQVSAEEAKQMLMEAIGRGQKIINYMGHGSVGLWRANLLTAEEARELNGRRTGLAVLMTCLNGYFQDAVIDSLGEALMKAEGGAVAVWSSSGITLPAEQEEMNREIYRQLLNGQGIRIGEAVRRAKQVITDADIRRTWILLGDPSMKLR